MPAARQEGIVQYGSKLPILRPGLERPKAATSCCAPESHTKYLLNYRKKLLDASDGRSYARCEKLRRRICMQAFASTTPGVVAVDFAGHFWFARAF